MIDTVIQCSKCEELVSVIARKISFPFVCDECNPEEKMEYEVAQDKILKDMYRVESFGSEGEAYIALFTGPDAEQRAQEYAASQNSNRTFVLGGEPEPEPEPEPYFDHNDATVENTNTLIDNLEEQLAQANADKDALVADIENLGEQFGFVTLSTLRLLEGLTKEVEQAQEFEIKSHLALAEALKQNSELKTELKIRDAQIANSDSLVKSLGDETARLYRELSKEKMSRESMSLSRDFYRDLSVFRGKGLDWANRSVWRKIADFFGNREFDGDPQPDPQPA